MSKHFELHCPNKENGLSKKDFFQFVKTNPDFINQQASRSLRHYGLAEFMNAWLFYHEACHETYYKLSPPVMQILIGGTHGDVRMCDIKLPSPAFAILLPVDGMELNSGCERIHAILVASRPAKRGHLELFPCGEGSFQYSSLPLGEATVNETIASALDSQFVSYKGMSKQQATQELRTIMSLVLSVTFLAVNHSPLVAPDVLDRDRMRFLLGKHDPEVVATLHERAQGRRGKTGYVVGDSEINLLDYRRTERCDSDPTGRQLTYQHMRNGHWANVRCGAGWLETRRIFRLPTLVRPDLSPNPDKFHGFVIR